MEGQPRAVLCDHMGAVTCVAISTDQNIVASGSAGRLLLHTMAGDLVLPQSQAGCCTRS